MRYVLDLQPHDREGSFAQLTDKLLDAQGHPLMNLEKPVPIDEIRKGLSIRAVREAYVSASGRDRLGDFLWYRVCGNPPFSNDLMGALDDGGIVIDPAVYRLPLHVVIRGSRILRREYTLLWATKEWDVLDHARAQVEYYTGTDVIREVKQWVFDPEETPDFDLFRTRYYVWIVSERFKNVVEQGHFSGFVFRPTY